MLTMLQAEAPDSVVASVTADEETARLGKVAKDEPLSELQRTQLLALQELIRRKLDPSVS